MKLARGRLGDKAGASVLSWASPGPDPEPALHLVCPSKQLYCLALVNALRLVNVNLQRSPLEDNPAGGGLTAPAPIGSCSQSSDSTRLAPAPRPSPPCYTRSCGFYSVDGTCAVPNQAKGRAVFCSPVSPAGSALGLVHRGLNKYLLNNGPLGSDV